MACLCVCLVGKGGVTVPGLRSPGGWGCPTDSVGLTDSAGLTNSAGSAYSAGSAWKRRKWGMPLVFGHFCFRFQAGRMDFLHCCWYFRGQPSDWLRFRFHFQTQTSGSLRLRYYFHFQTRPSGSHQSYFLLLAYCFLSGCSLELFSLIPLRRLMNPRKRTNLPIPMKLPTWTHHPPPA